MNDADKWAALNVAKIFSAGDGFLVATKDGNKFSGATLSEAIAAGMAVLPLPVPAPEAPPVTEEPAP